MNIPSSPGKLDKRPSYKNSLHKCMHNNLLLLNYCYQQKNNSNDRSQINQKKIDKLVRFVILCRSTHK